MINKLKSYRIQLITVIFAIAALVTVITIYLIYDSKLDAFQLRKDFSKAGINAQGLMEYKHKKTGILFVKVPSGSFLMGSPESELYRHSNEGPQKMIHLKSFLVAKYEVSQKIWKNVMGSNPSFNKRDHFPVEGVSWNDSKNFCRKSNLSLPTEKQWEYFCRAGTTGSYSFGEDITTDQGNFIGYKYKGARLKTVRNNTLPVDSLVPNPWGLHHVHGNVWEWCEDKPKSYKYPKVNTFGDKRTGARGGSYVDHAPKLRSAGRFSIYTNGKYKNVGFRPVYNLD